MDPLRECANANENETSGEGDRLASFRVERLSRSALTWLRSADFHGLYSQLTECTMLDEDDFREWFESITSDDRVVLFGIVHEDTQTCKVALVGTGCLHFAARYYRALASSASVEDLVVDSAFRGRGLASMLVQGMVRYAHARKVYKISLHCKVPLLGFYEANGFAHKYDHAVVELRDARLPRLGSKVERRKKRDRVGQGEGDPWTFCASAPTGSRRAPRRPR